MTEQQPTAEQIAEHRAFLARITANARARVEAFIPILSMAAATYEIDMLLNAAQEEISFLHRAGLDPDDPDAPPVDALGEANE